MSYFGIPIRNGLPIGLGSVAPLASGGGSPFSPLSLFAGGAPGAWYDPSDYTTLFQDSAGTTPVTAVEQPVGLMLDKSQGLVLGSELVPSTIPSISGAGWTTNGTSITATSSTASGTIALTASTPSTKFYQVTFTASGLSGATSYMVFSSGVSAVTKRINTAKSYSFIVPGQGTAAFEIAPYEGTAFSVTISNISVKELPGNHAFQATSASRPVLSARVNKLLATATLATQSVTTRAAAHTLRFEGAGSVTLTGTAIGVYTAGTHSITTTAGTLTLTVLGSVTSADLRETNDGVGVPAYQAVVTSTNYATTGFLPYLKFDGVDDSLSTNSISFTSTDKMSVFAGVRKLSDAALGMLLETSASMSSNTGCIYITAPNAASPDYSFASKGSLAGIATTAALFPAPLTNVLTGLANISGDLATLRINGTQVAQSTSDQGTGNYGNYPLYIGRRAGSSLPFNGQLYSMIIVGKAVTAGELTSTETYVNSKTGAYA